MVLLVFSMSLFGFYFMWPPACSWCCLLLSDVVCRKIRSVGSLITEILVRFRSWPWPNYIGEDRSLITLLTLVSRVLCSSAALAFTSSHSLGAVRRSADLSALALDLWIPCHLLLFCSVIHSSARVWNKNTVLFDPPFSEVSLYGW